MGGELGYIDAAVAKDAGFPVDPADTGSSGYDAFKALRRRSGGGHVVPRSLQVGPAVRGHSLHQHTGRNTLLYRIFDADSKLPWCCVSHACAPWSALLWLQASVA